MLCSNCQKEYSWMEIIGSDFVCQKCVQKHPIMRLIYNRHLDTFRSVIKRLAIKNYAEFMAIKREQLEKSVNFDKIGIKLKTTNIISID
ncbi:MAG: hypothetical protein V1837_07700 [Candidatus Woesearchaeota archaeon]